MIIRSSRTHVRHIDVGRDAWSIRMAYRQMRRCGTSVLVAREAVVTLTSPWCSIEPKPERFAGSHVDRHIR